MKKIEAVFVADRVLIEGSFKYALTAYSSFPAIKDEKFHELRNKYKSGEKGIWRELKKYILDHAEIKSFSEKAVYEAYNSFKHEEVMKEDQRWHEADQKSLNELLVKIGLKNGQ